MTPPLILQGLVEMVLPFSLDPVGHAVAGPVVVAEKEQVVKYIDEKPDVLCGQVFYIGILCPRESPHAPLYPLSQRGCEGHLRKQGAQERYTPRGEIGGHATVYAEQEKGDHGLLHRLSLGGRGVELHAPFVLL